jgi:hypothetical protein
VPAAAGGVAIRRRRRIGCDGGAFVFSAGAAVRVGEADCGRSRVHFMLQEGVAAARFTGPGSGPVPVHVYDASPVLGGRRRAVRGRRVSARDSARDPVRVRGRRPSRPRLAGPGPGPLPPLHGEGRYRDCCVGAPAAAAWGCLSATPAVSRGDGPAGGPWRWPGGFGACWHADSQSVRVGGRGAGLSVPAVGLAVRARGICARSVMSRRAAATTMW